MHAVRLAMARQDAGVNFLNGAVLKAALASQAQSQAPSISAGGVVPLCGTVSIIQPGEWVTIYGTNLASETAVWNGDFPTSLGGTKVEIDGKAAYLQFVSPGQINLQAPDDMATGPVRVVVTTDAGTAMATVTLSQFSPSFDLLETGHVAGIILRPDGSELTAEDPTTSSARPGILLAIPRWPRRQATRLNSLPSGSGRPPPPSRLDRRFPVRRRPTARCAFTSIMSASRRYLRDCPAPVSIRST